MKLDSKYLIKTLKLKHILKFLIQEIKVIEDLTICSDESFIELDTCFQAIMAKMNSQEILPQNNNINVPREQRKYEGKIH